MVNYRKIWEKYYGEIPNDEEGRPYDIHHIDGDRNNNSISNLKAVSIREHYEIHRSQKDWPACNLISQRLTLSKEEVDQLRKNMSGENSPTKRADVREKMRNNHADFKKEKHPGWGKKRSEETRNKISIALRTNGSLAGVNNPMYGNGHKIRGEKHGMYGKNHTFEAIQKMKIPKSEAHKQKLRKPKKKVQCDQCKKMVDLANMKRWHGDNMCNTRKKKFNINQHS